MPLVRADLPDGSRRAPSSDRIERDLAGASAATHDLIVIGGGIYGIALCLEAARRGLEVVLVERADFGGATSWSSLRILHGGLRYLQGLDLMRFAESVGERSWFLRHFPELTRPLPCLMPLYGRGLKRPAVFRAALAVNDILSWRRNAGITPTLHLPRGRVVTADEAVALFPAVDRRGLRGGALWHDAVMLSPERIAIAMLRWACACGAAALNYVEATGLITGDGAVRGVVALDRIGGGEIRLQASTVVNATGPWSAALARHVGSRAPASLFRPALAFNLLLNRPAIATVAVAVEPRRSDPPTYFCLPWQGLLLAGTSYAPVESGEVEAAPDAAQIASFLADLNRAVPGLGATPEDVLQVYAGLLPSKATATIDLANREVIHDHGAAGRPKGLFSVSGVKYTTARLVAHKTLAAAFGKALPGLRGGAGRPPPAPAPGGRSFLDEASPLDRPADILGAQLRALAEQESALSLEDLLLRRMDSTLAARDRDAATRVRAALGTYRLPDVVPGPSPL